MKVGEIVVNCPYCRKYFAKKGPTLDHINRYHGNRLEADGMDAAQALYFSTHGTLKGKCQCGCGRDTEWNYKTGKPYRVSNDPECRENLRKLALNNHRKVYGKDTLLNDMNHQKNMQKNRPSAGEYKFKDGGKVPYLSKLERGFLYFCDIMMEFTSNMVQESPETFTYRDPKDDNVHQYIPDYYLPDYNLLIEIKDGGKHPNTNPEFIKETKYKVALKDAAMKKQTKYNYIKIVDHEYGPFMELLYQITHSEVKGYQQPAGNFIVITESACYDVDEHVDFFLETVNNYYDNVKETDDENPESVNEGETSVSDQGTSTGDPGGITASQAMFRRYDVRDSNDATQDSDHDFYPDRELGPNVRKNRTDWTRTYSIM